MDEATKALKRLKNDPLWSRLRGKASRVLDIGAGKDCIEGAEGWDIQHGDAQKLEGVPSGTYDFIFSSHCLEHMRNPIAALRRWVEVLAPGGALWVLVPDAELYEHHVWPSVFNGDHKWAFSAYNATGLKRVMPYHINVVDMLRDVDGVDLKRLALIDTAIDYDKLVSQPGLDQTLGDGEAAIEIVLVKDIAPLNIRTPLAYRFKCGKCESGDLRLEGLGASGELVLRCNNCGNPFSVKGDA
jgi:SAM-dependent methyltransferase